MNSYGSHWFYSCHVIMGCTNQRLNQTCSHAHREFRTERAIPIYNLGGFWREDKFVDPSSPGKTGNKSGVGLPFIKVSESWTFRLSLWAFSSCSLLPRIALKLFSQRRLDLINGLGRWCVWYNHCRPHNHNNF